MNIGKMLKGNVVEYTESYIQRDKAKFTFRAKDKIRNDVSFLFFIKDL